MHVVTAFPPPYREAAAKVGNKDTDQCVNDEVLSDASVPSIMRGEHNLMLRCVRGRL